MTGQANALVIGGTGTTGRLVAAELRAAGVAVRIATRNPGPADPDHVRFEWQEAATHGPAVAGMDGVYLIPPIGVAEPAPLVGRFLEAATRAGVRRVVLLSSSAVADNETGLGALPPLVRAMPEWAVLRPSWFMQNFVGRLAAGIRERGEVVTATGRGRVAFVDAADIAAVAARSLTDAAPHDTDHVITGPEALGYDDATAIITAVTGHPVRHRAVSTAEMTDTFAGLGIDRAYAAVLAGLDEDIRNGAEDRITSTVQDVTGRPARSFTEFVGAHRGVLTPRVGPAS